MRGDRDDHAQRREIPGREAELTRDGTRRDRRTATALSGDEARDADCHRCDDDGETSPARFMPTGRSSSGGGEEDRAVWTGDGGHDGTPERLERTNVLVHFPEDRDRHQIVA